MKLNYSTLIITVLLSVATIMTSCDTKHRDVTVKTDLTTKARVELDFVGVRFTVAEGIVTLNGECPTGKARNKVENTVKNLYGVKAVVNNLRIADVVIGTDLLLKQAVDSVLGKYAGVEAITKDSIVTIRGNIERSELSILNNQLMRLQPKRLQQEIVSY